MYYRGRTMFAPTTQSQSPVNRQNKKSDALFAFSFAKTGAKEKAIKKKSAEMKFRALRSTTRATCPCPSRLLKKAGENFC